MLDPSKPLLFAAMPFGEKSEPGGARIVDFDTLYEQCVKPAAATTDVEVIRADEETLGGIIHRPMYERLLLSEIVIADLTFANANVFYELGVRHAARPRSTILMYAKVGQLPFDVGLIRAIPYELDAAGALVDPSALRDELSTRLALARDDDAADSPLFQLLDDYPGIDLTHDVTEAFRARAVWVSELTVRAHEAVKPPVDVAAAAATLQSIEAETSAVRGSEEQLMVMLMLAYRDISAWEDMIRVAESLPARLRAIATIREQLAMALSRRNGPGDRTRAIDVVERVIEEFGESPESLGILGRCFKARWREKHAANDPGAVDALDQAIDAYSRGFNADPRDFYPGVNLVTLLGCRHAPEDLARLEDLLPVVGFAVGRKGGLRTKDYWVLATVLELAAIAGEEPRGRRALSAMLDTQPAGWMRTTTADNLELVVTDVAPALERPTAWVLEVVDRLREEA